MKKEAIQRLGDEDLIAHVEDKNPVAFEVFYDRHGGAAYSLAYRMVGEKLAAEDITQEAFLSIWRTGARFDRSRGSVRSWTLGVVRNRAIDSIRRDSGRAPKLTFDPQEVIEREPAPEQTEAEAMRRETARELQGALSDIPSEQSHVIELAYFGGFSQSEIAEMLGEPLGTVKGRMRLGMEKIRINMTEAIA
jgi:RNA polymerase sigma-70 factor, ECF subfamily